MQRSLASYDVYLSQSLKFRHAAFYYTDINYQNDKDLILRLCVCVCMRLPNLA